jgi:hypothetical protein
MKTEKIYLNDCLFAIEINNVYVSCKNTSSILRSIDGVTSVRVRKAFSRETSDFRVAFKYFGVECVVQEPYGDSSDYWIGPVDEKPVPSFELINKRFETYCPPYWRRLLGGLISLDLKAVFGGEV